MRLASDTKLEALRQLRDGLKGDNISKRQTDTGVKDGVVTHFLQGTTFLDDIDDTDNVLHTDDPDDALQIDEAMDVPARVELPPQNMKTRSATTISDLSDAEKVNPMLSVEGKAVSHSCATE